MSLLHHERRKGVVIHKMFICHQMFSTSFHSYCEIDSQLGESYIKYFMAPSILRSYDFSTFFFLISQLFSEFLHIERKLHKESLDIFAKLQKRTFS